MTSHLHLIIRGRVQGVGFRFATLHQAAALNLNGWVRNQYDGAVEARFEGDPKNLKQILEWAQTGPISADVTNVESQWCQLDTPQFTDFRIRP